MGRSIAFFALLFISLHSSAQDTSQLLSLKLNRTEARDNAGLGYKSKPCIEYPIGSNQYALNRLDFWVTGISATGDTIAAVSNPFTTKSAWIKGPTNESRKHPANWRSFHNMTAAIATAHKLNYSKNGYVMPQDIQIWPASYNAPGFPSLLAPFADVNTNGEYNPELGDYPFVPGTSQYLTIASDSMSLLFNGQPSSGLELSVLWFTPDMEDSFPGTLFYRTTLCNRGTQAIEKTSIAAVADFRIGDLSDDFMATDVKHNAILGFNGPGNDNVYGASWPGVAVGWLSEPAKNSMYFLNTNDAPHGRPVYKGDYYLLSKGYWKTASPLSFGNSGLDGSPVSSFVYSNGTDPNMGLADWDEPAGNAGRQTALISIGDFTLQPGACRIADGQVTLIPDAPDSNRFSQHLEKVTKYYAGSDFSMGVAEVIQQSRLNMFPNPVRAGAELNFVEVLQQESISIYNAAGLEVLKYNSVYSTVTAPEIPGIYIVKSSNGRSSILIVQ